MPAWTIRRCQPLLWGSALALALGTAAQAAECLRPAPGPGVGPNTGGPVNRPWMR